MKFRPLTSKEINILQQQGCQAENWDNIEVAEAFKPEYVQQVKFTGHNRIGTFENMVQLSG
jgi:hypothetical protein